MRRSGAGVPSSGRPTPISCAVGAPAPATHGTSTRSSSKINGKIHYLWRAVDQHGNVLDILVQPRRDAKAAKKFFRRLLKGLRYVPRVLVTDKLASYGPAHRVVMPSVEHRQSKYLNNRGRELASTDPATRAGDETVHLASACATVPVRVQPHLATFPPAPASAVGHRMAPRDGRPLHRLEPDHRGYHDRRMNVNWDRAFH